MFNTATIILAICLYMGFLFTIARWVDKRSEKGRSPANNAWVYSLSLAIYCTSWTYYGSVGKAASSGMLFLAIYLGPTLAIVLWWKVLRKLVRIKQINRVGSIADFIAVRYGKSQRLAAVATLIALIGIAPYIALQFKAVIATMEIMVPEGADAHSWVSGHAGPVMAVLMIAFTIIFGVRRLDPTERHEGMVVAVAVESIVKLISFLAAGIFVTYFLFNGFGDIFDQIRDRNPFSYMKDGKVSAPSFSTWITYFILAMSAILFLPRQFHVAVVENSNEKQIRTAMWVFPLYMLLINLFVLPIALGGLLKGLPFYEADTFVLKLPLEYGGPVLTLLVFIGGFSAATSMIMISSMTLATMISNHLVLPLVNWIAWLQFLRRYILKIRWVAVAAVIMLGYWFERSLGGSYTLVNMGMISFAAALQFAPLILGGIFWRGANRTGATLGLSAGFMVWFYTLLLPSFVRSGWISISLIENGPFGLEFLKPEQLFGMTGFEPLTHAVFWTMLCNIGLYVLGSLFFQQSEDEIRRTDFFLHVLKENPPSTETAGGSSHILLADKIERIVRLLCRYYEEKEARNLVRESLKTMGLEASGLITAIQLAELCSSLEKRLSGSIGASIAFKTFKHGKIFNSDEAKEISMAYATILANLKVAPDELSRKIDYYQEREKLITANSEALEEKVAELQEHIRERERVEHELLRLRNLLRNIIDSMPSMMVGVDGKGRVTQWNHKAEEVVGITAEQAEGRPLEEVLPEMKAEVGKIRLAIQGRKIQTSLNKISEYGGELRYSDVTIYPLVSNGIDGAVIRVDDVTERVRMEEMMIQSEKMISVGGLAAGMAHEINNPLAGILQNVQVMRNRLVDKLPANVRDAEKCGISVEAVNQYMEMRGILEMLENIMQSGSRAAHIVDNMLSFSRKGGANAYLQSLAELCDRTIELAYNEYDLKKNYDFRSIEIVREYDPAAPEVWCTAGEIQQVILNILQNGAQAMAEKPETPSQFIVRVLADSEGVRVEIEDNGPGMRREVRKRVFEPFFTTKEIGVGTGLGLSVSYFIITENHGGTMTVESTPGKGTTFIIHLPVEKPSNKRRHSPICSDITRAI
ncbi:MAG: ATP-binding protein [Planctomycetota bacterium]